MAEMFEGRYVDWNEFTAKDAVKYTEEAQKYAQEKEYIDTIKGIANAASLGKSKLILNKILTDYAISKLESNGFKVSSIKQKAYRITTYTPGCETSDYWETTIEW